MNPALVDALRVTTEAPSTLSSQLSPQLSPDLLSALADLIGVADAAPDDADGSAGRLRLTLDDGVDEQRVLAAAEAVITSRVGGGTSRVGVVEEVGRISGDGRLALEQLRLVTSGSGVAASMRLTLDDRTATGSAELDRSDDAAVAEAVVGAALLALEELTEDAVIGTVERAAVDDDGVARIRLRLDVDGTDVATEGEASVLVHRPQAIVRAVLAALEPHLPD
ncbi:MAG: hypothetical protein QOJ32_1653 [Frankiaceae bacterium]|nr:hypothetical protein [Frankiaceae bacterium]